MPRRDGTGPTGIGPKTGRGLGPCTGPRLTGYCTGLVMGLGRRFFRRRGFAGGHRRGFGINRNSAGMQKKLF